VPGRERWFALGFLGRGFGPRRSRLSQGAANTGPRRRSRRRCCNVGANGDAIESYRCCFKCSADRRLLRFELITCAYALQTPAPVGFAALTGVGHYSPRFEMPMAASESATSARSPSWRAGRRAAKRMKDFVPKTTSFLYQTDDLRTARDRSCDAAQEMPPVIDNTERRRLSDT